MFPDTEHVRDMQQELDQVIQTGVANITGLLRAAEARTAGHIADDEDDFEMKNRSQRSSSFEVIDNDRGEFAPEELTRLKKSQNSNLTKSDSDLKSPLSDSLRLAKKLSVQSNSDIKIGQGRLTHYFLKLGVFTPEELARMQQEWQSSSQNCVQDGSKNLINNIYNTDTNTDTDTNNHKPTNKRGRKR